MKKLLGLLFIVLVIVIAIFGLSRNTNSVPTEADLDRIKVVASFYPLAHFAEKVGRDFVDVELFISAGADPHTFEPGPQDIIRAQSADLFIFQGAGFDSWAENLVSNLDTSKINILEVSRSFDLMRDQEDLDPHIWLDPDLSKQIVSLISNSLSDLVGEEDKAKIFENAAAYQRELSDLDARFKSGLESCKTNKIVVAHDAFGYMAARYGFEIIAIAGLSPQDQPSSRRLVELADLIKKEGIDYIFFEELTSPKLASTLADEVGAETLILNPLEGLSKQQIDGGEDYISVMEENLENLQIALGC